MAPKTIAFWETDHFWSFFYLKLNLLREKTLHLLLGKLSALEIFSAADNNLEMIREGISIGDIYSQDHGVNFRF
jgi:hypothetical protein